MMTNLVEETRFLNSSTFSQKQPEEAIENTHQGWFVVADETGRCLYRSALAAETCSSFFRSCAKPFQALPLVLEGFHTHWDPKTLAVICSSHSGAPEHTTRVSKILSAAGLSADDLQCGIHEPLDTETKLILNQDNQPATRLHHNCSGKHAGMLFYCVAMGEETASYLKPTHPVQQKILQGIQAYSGLDSIPTGIDGCGTPVYALPLKTMAKLYARLQTEDVFQPIRSAMCTYPLLVAGKNRIDTAIMTASGGKILSKVGADGVICLSRINESSGRAEGLAFKLASGRNSVRDIAIVLILEKLGWLSTEELAHPLLHFFYSKQSRKNTHDQSVGRVVINLAQ
ncbi:MAG: asparaginase [Cyanobacteria bacterium P01_H01_bin.74]